MIVPYDKKQSNSSLSIKGIEPNNHIDTSQKISLINPNLDLGVSIDAIDNKKKLGIELIKEIINSRTITKEDKEKYRKIQKKIHSHYYYCFEEVHENNFHMIKYFEENEMIMENKIIYSLPEKLDYDVEFYKIGKICNGLKKRYGIIKRNGFYSSKKPLEKADEKKMKDKTEYLPGSEVIIQRKDEIGKEEGEWSNKNKIYRIRINYIREKKEDNPKHSSFFFYFNDESQMMLVYNMLFGLSLNKDYKLRAKRSLSGIKLSLHRDNNFYVILKILTVKQKIKIRKKIIKKVNNVVHGEMFNKLYPNVVKSLKKYASRRNNDIDKFLKSDKKGNNQCEINVEFIYFRQDFQFNINILPTYLYFSISVEDDFRKNQFSDFKNPEYGFQKELLKNQKKNKTLRTSEENVNLKGNGHKSFKKKVKINKNNINQKRIYLNQNMKNDFDINREDKTQIYYLNIEIRKCGFYYSSFDLSEIDNSQRCNKLELPIYKKDDKRIYGCVGIDLMEKDDSGQDFQEKFNELNKNYLILPHLVLKHPKDTKFKLENYHFGLYEPNIFRRKILNFIHDKNIDPKIIDENDSNTTNNLKDELLKKCVDLSHFKSFKDFDFSGLKKNFDLYRKKLGLKLLEIKRHEEFMKQFRKSEWDIYKNAQIDFNNISKYNFIEENNDVNTFHSLIYLGIHPEYREIIYRKILEIDELVKKTKVKLGNNYDNDNDNEQKIFLHFTSQVIKSTNKKNLIFSLIDNDCIFLYSLADITLDDINAIKKIAKAFFYWTELKIGLSKNIEKYVYFIGILSIIEKLRKCFKKDYLVFWVLIGLSQYIDHFSQQNPLFTDDMNYINVYGLVTKLILEQYFKEIYDKFISLNFPIEFFISRHLSTLFTDYFNGELMMRIFDIIIFESSFKGKFKDNLHYLRILCSIPITLFELSKKKILACESVSEIESILNNLISHNFNNNKFIFALEKNVNKFFISPGFKTQLFYKQNLQEWDNKRGDIEDLNYKLFRSVNEENNKYLKKIEVI